jgi:hypothetical protein
VTAAVVSTAIKETICILKYRTPGCSTVFLPPRSALEVTCAFCAAYRPGRTTWCFKRVLLKTVNKLLSFRKRIAFYIMQDPYFI